MKKIDKVPAAIGAVAAVGLLAVGVPAIAGAASPTPSPQSTNRPAAPGYSDRGRHLTAETELTGATAEKVKAAVLAKLPGATVTRMSAEDSDEGSGAAYEAHVTKTDGTEVEVLLDKSFSVTSVNAGRGRGFGRGRHGKPPAGDSGSNPSAFYSSTSV